MEGLRWEEWAFTTRCRPARTLGASETMVWRDFLLYWVCKVLNVRLLAISARRGGRRATAAFKGVTQERIFLGLGEGFRFRWQVEGLDFVGPTGVYTGTRSVKKRG